jgi:hypothetical protein
MSSSQSSSDLQLVQIHNAMLNNIGGLRQTFDNLARMFDDRTWTRDNMQSFFKLLERNLYLTPPKHDHGFDGWLSTTLLSSANFSSTGEFLRLVPVP